MPWQRSIRRRQDKRFCANFPPPWLRLCRPCNPSMQKNEENDGAGATASRTNSERVEDQGRHAELTNHNELHKKRQPETVASGPDDAGDRARGRSVESLGHAAREVRFASGGGGVTHGLGHEDGVLSFRNG